MRATRLFHRTNLATRIVRGANEGAEIHHSVLEIARVFSRNELCRSSPQLLPARGGIDWRANIKKAGENASGVGFDDGQGLVESENCDGIRSVKADARQRFQLIGIIGKSSAKFFDDHFAAAMEMACPAIVTQPLPGVENIRFSRSGKQANSGEPAQPSIIVRDNSAGLGLLEHDFGDKDGIGIEGLAPGKIAFVA